MAGGVRVGHGDAISNDGAYAYDDSRDARTHSGTDRDGIFNFDAYAYACANGRPNGDANTNRRSGSGAKADADSIETAARDSHARSYRASNAHPDAYSGADARPGKRGVGRHTGNNRPDQPGMAAGG